MSYKVRTASFEGPFDLLLYLVSRQKVDIGAISITEIADQYLAEVTRMKNLDLDVASDFLLVASTLLEIKAQSLIPQDTPEIDDDIAELTPSEARDILVERAACLQAVQKRERRPSCSLRVGRPHAHASVRTRRVLLEPPARLPERRHARRSRAHVRSCAGPTRCVPSGKRAYRRKAHSRRDARAGHPPAHCQPRHLRFSDLVDGARRRRSLS